MKKIFCLVIIIFLISGCANEKVVSKDMLYMNTYINIKIYGNDEQKINDALDKIDTMFADYNKLSDRYKDYDNVINIKYINEKLSLNEELKIDTKLYDILKYCKSYKEKTNNLFNITLGNAIDVWKSYRDGIKKGVPTIDELKNSGSIDEDALVLKDNNIIVKTSDISIDLGAITKGYVTELAATYLENIGLNKYIITAGTSSVKVGTHYANGKYKIGLTNPTDTADRYKVIKGNNIAITTSGSFENYYDYDGVRYHHIIDPITLFPKNYMLSVTIITKDAALGEILSTTLFLMPIDEGIEYIKQFDGVEAIWYGVDNKITKSDGMVNYE